MQFRIAIIGSRSFTDYEVMERVLNERLKGIQPIIISGGARGADTLARRYAEDNGLIIKEHLPDDSHGYPAALFIRNTKIADDCYAMYAFWDLASTGTLDAMTKTYKQKKAVYIFNKKFGYEPLAFNPNIKYDTDFDVLDKFLE